MELDAPGDDMAAVFATAVRCLREISDALDAGDHLAGECTMLAHSLRHRVRCGELPSARPVLAFAAADAPR